jgi:hypothetical protein
MCVWISFDLIVFRLKSTTMAGTNRRRTDPQDGSKKPHKHRSDIRKPSNKILRKYSPKLNLISKNTILASAVLAIAIATSLLFNHFDPVDPKVKTFFRNICNDPQVYCHPGLVPSRRTHTTRQIIVSGIRVLELPRRLQIWDVDALRDAFIQRELFSMKGRIFSSAAFLAAYLARQFQNASSLEPLLAEWLGILPQHDDFRKFHPVLWTDDEL